MRVTCAHRLPGAEPLPSFAAEKKILKAEEEERKREMFWDGVVASIPCLRPLIACASASSNRALRDELRTLRQAVGTLEETHAALQRLEQKARAAGSDRDGSNGNGSSSVGVPLIRGRGGDVGHPPKPPGASNAQVFTRPVRPPRPADSDNGGAGSSDGADDADGGDAGGGDPSPVDELRALTGRVSGLTSMRDAVSALEKAMGSVAVHAGPPSPPSAAMDTAGGAQQPNMTVHAYIQQMQAASTYVSPSRLPPPG